MAHSQNFYRKHYSQDSAERFFRRKPKKFGKSDLEIIGNLISQTFSKHGMQKDYDQWKIFALWNTTLGKPLTLFAQPEKFYRGTLSVAVKNSTWMQELQFMKQELLDRLNREISASPKITTEQIPLDATPIKTIRFFICAKLPQWGTPEKVVPSLAADLDLSTVPPAIQEKAKELTQKIEDSDLRVLLERLYIKTKSPKR